jgi:RimJ/RimL family protein N-acetyltransferase
VGPPASDAEPVKPFQGPPRKLPTVHYRSLEQADAHAIARWEYPAPYDAYSRPFRDPEQVALLLEPAAGYYALLSEDGKLVGYFCLGAAGRIAGGAYRGTGLDLGLALRPDLAGLGQAAGYTRAVMRQLACERSAEWIRVTIEAWNRRARRLCEGLGFRRVAVFGGFRRARAGNYVVLARPTRGL